MFLLARNEKTTKIQIVQGHFEIPPTIGQAVERDPVTCGSPQWTVVKVFDDDEQRRLTALASLIGYMALKNLFDLEL
jgi:hypothetical protein